MLSGPPSGHLSVVLPLTLRVTQYLCWPVLGLGISVKLVANIHHLSGHS